MLMRFPHSDNAGILFTERNNILFATNRFLQSYQAERIDVVRNVRTSSTTTFILALREDDTPNSN